MQDIDRIHLQTVLNRASGKNRTQQQILLTFKQVLKSAVADHLFPANVMEDIFRNTEPVKYHAEEKRALADSEKKTVFGADFKTQDKIFIYIIYGYGLRREEALALTIFDFSLKDRTVNINKAHAFVNGKAEPIKKESKTKNGYRTLPIKKIAQLMGDTEAVVLKVYNHMVLEKEDAGPAVNDAMNF